MLTELVESMQVPSAVVLVRSSEFGDATFRFGSWVLGGDDLPATSDHYRIGSITKTMTATVILQLAQEGKLVLDDPISKYRPDVPNGDNISIAQLLDMRSGLAGYTENPMFQQAVDDDPERIWTPDELLALAFSVPPLFPPGTAWQYSNTNYVLLGLVMEDVTGQSVAELFQERLFDPLGWTAPSCRPSMTPRCPRYSPTATSSEPPIRSFVPILRCLPTSSGRRPTATCCQQT